jgi:hypothetical protein
MTAQESFRCQEMAELDHSKSDLFSIGMGGGFQSEDLADLRWESVVEFIGIRTQALHVPFNKAPAIRFDASQV